MESNSDRNVQSINQQILKSLSNKVNQFIRFLKTYSPIIGGLPLLLGGLHQIASLIIIGPGYVRFFSVTQLLSDGLILLLIIGTYLLCLIFSYYIIFPFLEDRFKLEENKDKTYDLYVVTVYMILMASVIFLQIDFSLSNFKEIFEENYPRVYSELVPVFIIRLIIILAIVGSIGYWINWNRYFKNLFKFMVILLGLGIFLQITITTFDKGLNIFIPADLNNLNNLNCDKGDGKSELKLLYFNDKYAFLEDDSLKGGISVLELEKLLNLNPCEYVIVN